MGICIGHNKCVLNLMMILNALRNARGMFFSSPPFHVFGLVQGTRAGYYLGGSSKFSSRFFFVFWISIAHPQSSQRQVAGRVGQGRTGNADKVSIDSIFDRPPASLSSFVARTVFICTYIEAKRVINLAGKKENEK